MKDWPSRVRPAREDAIAPLVVRVGARFVSPVRSHVWTGSEFGDARSVIGCRPQCVVVWRARAVGGLVPVDFEAMGRGQSRLLFDWFPAVVRPS